MALRDFTDSNGNRWRVWNVSPHLPLRVGDGGPAEPSSARTPAADELQRRLVPGLEGGWLCFEAEEEKRRLNPIPEAWEELGAPGLRRLLDRAVPVGRREG